MYNFVLITHNLFRWVVVLAAVYALYRAYTGWFGKKEWTSQDRRAGSLFTVAMDIQLLLGLILYIFGEWYLVLSEFREAMQNASLRFFGLEHIFYMLLAVVFGHLGSVLSRRAPDDNARHRRAAIWFTLVAIILIVGIPWFRPLLRL